MYLLKWIDESQSSILKIKKLFPSLREKNNPVNIGKHFLKTLLKMSIQLEINVVVEPSLNTTLIDRCHKR